MEPVSERREPVAKPEIDSGLSSSSLPARKSQSIDPYSVENLVKTIMDPDSIHAQRLDAVSRLSGSWSTQPELLPVMVHCLKDPVPLIRADAIRGLQEARIATPEVIDGLRERALFDTGRNQLQAVIALGVLAPQAARDVFSELLLSGGSDTLKRHALRGLHESGLLYRDDAIGQVQRQSSSPVRSQEAERFILQSWDWWEKR